MKGALTTGSSFQEVVYDGDLLPCLFFQGRRSPAAALCRVSLPHPSVNLVYGAHERFLPLWRGIEKMALRVAG